LFDEKSLGPKISWHCPFKNNGASQHC
jgi:hypothetical protein